MFLSGSLTSHGDPAPSQLLSVHMTWVELKLLWPQG